MSLDEDIEKEVQGKPSRYERAKTWLTDSGANFMYWQPVLTVWELTALQYSKNDLITARTANITLALFLGRPFGKAIDFGRKKLIPGYEEALQQLAVYEAQDVDKLADIQRKEYETLVSKVRGPEKFLDMFKQPHRKNALMRAYADTATTSVFWNATMIPWLRYSKDILENLGIEKISKYVGLSGTAFSNEQLLKVAIGYTILYGIAGAPYGQFLNWFRGVCNKDSQKSAA